MSLATWRQKCRQISDTLITGFIIISGLLETPWDFLNPSAKIYKKNTSQKNEGSDLRFDVAADLSTRISRSTFFWSLFTVIAIGEILEYQFWNDCSFHFYKVNKLILLHLTLLKVNLLFKFAPNFVKLESGLEWNNFLIRLCHPRVLVVAQNKIWRFATGILPS